MRMHISMQSPLLFYCHAIGYCLQRVWSACLYSVVLQTLLVATGYYYCCVCYLIP